MVTNISFVIFSGILVFYALFNIRGADGCQRRPEEAAPQAGRGLEGWKNWGFWKGWSFPGDSGDSGIPESSGEGLLALFF